MSEITYDQLTSGQKAAVDRVILAVNNKTNEKLRYVTVRGPAGTGKTTLTKVLLKKLEDMGVDGIILAAPTHAAKKVLTRLAGKEANTIHSILKINPSNYEDNQLFEQKGVPDLSKARVLVCDEASMYDKQLFDIIMKTLPSYCVIVGIGDKSQIRPVDTTGEAQVSKFFTDPRFEQVELDKVERYSGPLLEVATDIRNGNWIYGKTDENGNGSIQCPDFATLMRHYFSVVKTPEDLLNNRFAAFTNASVDKLNQIIRKHLYKTTEPFIKDEVVVMQEPLLKTVKYQGQKITEILFNNGQFVKVKEVVQKPLQINNRGVGESVTINCYSIYVETYDADDEYNSAWLNIIVDPEEKKKFYFYQGKTAEVYKNEPNRNKRYWSDYWESKGKFHEVKALPACTLHKTQGSTVDNMFLFTGCVHKAPFDLAIELLYVGSTRPRQNLYFV